MVQVMILRDFTRFCVITTCVMLPLGAGLSWRFEGGEEFFNMQRAWWSFMIMFVDAGSEQKLPSNVFRWKIFLNILFCCSSVTRINNKVNMQGRGPLWGKKILAFWVILTTRALLVGVGLL